VIVIAAAAAAAVLVAGKMELLHYHQEHTAFSHSTC
jgi:hypothetical protein